MLHPDLHFEHGQLVALTLEVDKGFRRLLLRSVDLSRNTNKGRKHKNGTQEGVCTIE
jgi:hypothetical protein